MLVEFIVGFNSFSDLNLKNFIAVLYNHWMLRTTPFVKGIQFLGFISKGDLTG